MTRKRAVKLLMARGYSRNLANGLMQNKPVNNSNLQAYKKYLCLTGSLMPLRRLQSSAVHTARRGMLFLIRCIPACDGV